MAFVTIVLSLIYHESNIFGHPSSHVHLYVSTKCSTNDLYRCLLQRAYGRETPADLSLQISDRLYRLMEYHYIQYIYHYILYIQIIITYAYSPAAGVCLLRSAILVGLYNGGEHLKEAEDTGFSFSSFVMNIVRSLELYRQEHPSL